MSHQEDHPSIFVSIASYRDPDCQNTINDLFGRARFPERVWIGVCLQLSRADDADCVLTDPSGGRLRIAEFDAAQSRGACWARHQVQALWRGEDYVLQIDSHMRFVDGWDECLITMLASCPARKPVLSTYPLAFTPPDQRPADALPTICAREFDGAGVLTQTSVLGAIEDAPAVPLPNAHIGAGLIFAAGTFVAELPYDPHLYFEGEEITLAVRMWTKGWDIFTPNAVVAYHDYDRRAQQRPHHWEDVLDWGQMNLRSQRRIRHLLGMEACESADDLVDLALYGLGSERTLADFEAFSGIDFKGRMVHGRPLLSPNIAADSVAQTEQRQRAFTDIWVNNFWGDAETRSGPSSSLASSAALRSELRALLAFLDIRVLADVGCGDLNWMQEITGGLRLYLGYDVVPDLVGQLRERFKARQNCFFTVGDVVTDALPECDAVLSRDCLTHLPLDAALLALRHVRQSNSRYFIATTNDIGRNVYVASGAWYPMDLCAAPFNLPAPLLSIQEGGVKRLGVWRVSDLPQ